VTVSALIKTFSTWPAAPVDIEEHVLPEFLKLGVKDEVYFWSDAKLDARIVRGGITHWEYPLSEQGPIVRVADITYSDKQPHEWQRLVCCKELLHLLDPENTRVAKDHDIEKLIEKIILPADLQDPFSDGIHALTDRVAITYAAAILFPLSARAKFIPRYNDGTLSLQTIAEALEIPVRHTALVLNDAWVTIHDMLVG
jgi:hypothetical protein